VRELRGDLPGQKNRARGSQRHRGAKASPRHRCAVDWGRLFTVLVDAVLNSPHPANRSPPVGGKPSGRQTFSRSYNESSNGKEGQDRPSNPELFRAHPHFSDAVNGNIIRSEIEGGVHLKDLSPGSALSVQTANRVYEMWFSETEPLSSPAIQILPEPTEVRIQGSTWGGSMLKISTWAGACTSIRAPAAPPHPDFPILDIARTDPR